CLSLVCSRVRALHSFPTRRSSDLTAKNTPQISPQGVSAFAEAAPTVVPAEAPRAGGEITVTGSGFAAGYPGIYLAIGPAGLPGLDRKSTRLNSSHVKISYAVFCLK